MSDIVFAFLLFRDHMKIYHWQTTSYARHVASDALVTGLDPLIDQFMEVYLGKLEGKRFSIREKSELRDVSDDLALEFMYDFKEFLMSELMIILPQGMANSDLINIRDEMLSLVNKTLYLFTLV